MAREIQMRQARLRLTRRRGSFQRDKLSCNAIRPQRGEHLNLHVAGRLRPVVGQIDDLSLLWTVNRGVWLVDEARHPLREPVISAGLLELPVHSLLNDDPMGLV